jgi:hypothetical protein
MPPPRHKQVRFWLVAGLAGIAGLTLVWMLLLWMFGQ